MKDKQDKAKLVVEFPYGGHVLDADKALAVMELLRGAERYRTKYVGGEVGSTHHIWAHSSDDSVATFKYLTDSQYALAKIAGKPED